MADVKITDLTAVASVVGTNTFEVTEDPSGTPVSKKATAAQLATYIDAAGAASSAVSTHVAAGDPHTQYKLESDFSANGASLVNAANYSSMRTLLSLVPGTDVQAFSSVLSTYAGIAPSANVQTLLGAADFAAFRTSLSLVVGTNVQAYDADLAAIAGLTATTDNFLQAKSSAWASRTPTQVTADLIAMVGDSGSGGTKGLVPAPAAGDAAAAKYLKADGTWATVSGGGGSGGREEIWIPAGSMIPQVTNGAAEGSGETTTNDVMRRTLDFDPTTAEYAQFSWRMPKRWNEGTVTFIPIWSHPSTTTNFGVVWDMCGVAISNDDALEAAFGSAQTSTDTGGTTDDLYEGPESSAITIAGTPAVGDVVHFRVARAPSNGSDTMAVDARLHGIVLVITTDAATDA